MKRNLVRVIVNVDDTNDNAPWFIGTPYSGRVFESAAVGSAVLQVTALDKDKGPNAEITYSIESGKCTKKLQTCPWFLFHCRKLLPISNANVIPFENASS